MRPTTDESDPDASRACRRLAAAVEALTRRLEDGGEADDDPRAAFEAVAGALQDLLAATDGGHRAINRRSGGTITPLEPDPADVELADVAHALSNLSRFTGQGREFYSVARHAVHVSREVEARGGSVAARRWALLHDASEAYLSDVPAPAKRSLPGYTHAEKRLQAAVREAFDIDLSSEDERLVDAADADVGRYELAMHFPDDDHEKPTLEVEPAMIDSSVDDEALFLRRARALGLAAKLE